MSYPDPHYDEDGTCPCPDHQVMRETREQEEAERATIAEKLLRKFLYG